MSKNIAVSLLFTVATIALLGYIWLGQTQQRLEVTNLRQKAQQLEFGQRNYEQYCASCHGLAGEGGGPSLRSAPSLVDLQTRIGAESKVYTDTYGVQKKYGTLHNYVEAIIAQGKPGTAMPAWKQQGMRDDQVRAIAAYVMSMQGGAVSPVALESSKVWAATTEAGLPPTATPSEPPPDDPAAAAGLQTFNTFCQSCHSKTADKLVGPGLLGLFSANGTVAYGTVLPNGKEVNDANVAEWIKIGGGGPGVGPEPKDGQNYTLMPGFPNLSDQQIAELIAYLKLLQ